MWKVRCVMNVEGKVCHECGRCAMNVEGKVCHECGR